jgi:hypothetical protein
MNTEKKATTVSRIFNLVRDVPGISIEQVHEALSIDPKYKTGSGRQIIYRLVCAKYIRKNKDGKLFAKIGKYHPLPPAVKKKKRVVDAAPSVVHTPVLPEKTGFFAKLRSFFK